MGRGLPALIVTGLPGAGVQDARERVRPAVEGAKLEWPLRRVVVNLAPANVRKEGPGLDLPLVMSVLAATRQIPSDRLRAFAFAGEVSLKGELLTTPGILTVAIAAARAGLRRDRRAGRQRRRGRAGRRAPRGRRGDAVRCGRIPSRDVVAARRGDADGRGTGRRDRGSRRGARPDAGAPGPRGRGGRRSQHAHGRIARGREDDARAAAADDPARALAGGIAGSDAAPFRRRTARFLEGTAPRPPVPRAAPFGLDGRAARRRQHARATRARSASRTTASCSSTSSPSSVATPSRDCGSRSRTAASSSRGPSARWSSPRGSPSWPQPTRVRAASTGTGSGSACADPTGSSCTGTSCRDRCSIGSTSGCASRGSPRRSCSAPRRERRPRGCASKGRGWRATGSADDGPRLGVSCNAHLPGPVARRTCSLSPDAENLLTKAVETSGAHRPWLRPRHQGRPDGRRPRRLGPCRGRSPGRGALVPDGIRTGGARACRMSRSRRRRAGGRPGFGHGDDERRRPPDAVGAARPAPAQGARGSVGAPARRPDASSPFGAAGWGATGTASGSRRWIPVATCARVEGAGARFVTPADPEYDDRLHDLRDPPACLFLLGRPLGDSPERVAIVGSRKCSNLGRDVAQDLGRALVASGLAVVSGAAHGIDAAAHRGALQAAGRTVAVLGSGIDVVYPASSRELLEADRRERHDRERVPARHCRRDRNTSRRGTGSSWRSPVRWWWWRARRRAGRGSPSTTRSTSDGRSSPSRGRSRARSRRRRSR